MDRFNLDVLFFSETDEGIVIRHSMTVIQNIERRMEQYRKPILVYYRDPSCRRFDTERFLFDRIIYRPRKGEGTNTSLRRLELPPNLLPCTSH